MYKLLFGSFIKIKFVHFFTIIDSVRFCFLEREGEYREEVTANGE